MIEVVVARLGVDPNTQSFVVVLQEKGGSRLLPIWIGRPEADSIVKHIHNMKRTRPLTHDLCRNLILALGGTLARVQITSIEQNTYFAEMHVVRGDDLLRVDARPSDSIALALRFDAPIFAAEALLEAPEPDSEEESLRVDIKPKEEELSAEQLKQYLEQLRPEDFGKFSL